MNNEEVKQLRSFGFIVGGGFAIIALWPTVFRNEHPRLVILILAGLLPRAHGAEGRAPEHRSREAQRAACRSAAGWRSRQSLEAASAESEGP